MNAPVLYLQGEFIHECEARIPVNDRSFLYGDGLFETLRVYRGKAFAWEAHWRRLETGARLLGLRGLPSSRSLLEAAAELIRRNDLAEAVLRLQISRGPGPRGYSPKGCLKPAVLMTLHPAPETSAEHPAKAKLITATWLLPFGQQLAQCKSASRLLYVLARSEADAAGADDAILLNLRNEVAETSSANFFWIERDIVWTPPVGSGALDGVTRRLVLELCKSLKIHAGERPLTQTHLKRVATAFLTSSVQEITRVTQVDRHRMESHPFVDQLHQAYEERVRAECP